MIRQSTHNTVVSGLKDQLSEARTQLRQTVRNMGILFSDLLPEKLAKMYADRAARAERRDKARDLAKKLLAYANAEDQNIELMDSVIATAEAILDESAEINEVEIPDEVAAALAALSSNDDTDA